MPVKGSPMKAAYENVHIMPNGELTKELSLCMLEKEHEIDNFRDGKENDDRDTAVLPESSQSHIRRMMTTNMSEANRDIE